MTCNMPQAMHSLEVLARIQNKTVTEVMEPHKEVLQDMIPPKKHLLRHQPANAQIGIMDGNTFCTTLEPRLFTIGESLRIYTRFPTFSGINMWLLSGLYCTSSGLDCGVSHQLQVWLLHVNSSWTKWDWDKFLSKFLLFPLLNIVLTLFCTHLLLPSWSVKWSWPSRALLHHWSSVGGLNFFVTALGLSQS